MGRRYYAERVGATMANMYERELASHGGADGPAALTDDELYEIELADTERYAYEIRRLTAGGAVMASRDCYFCTRLGELCYSHDDIAGDRRPS